MNLGITSALLVLLCLAPSFESHAADPTDPETTIRTLVRANIEKDIATLSRLMAHDADIISYTIGGRKYVGWPEFEREMREEFDSVEKFEIPIKELKVWTKGDLAWFAMELDYIRFVGGKTDLTRTVIPLRETGILERRQGQWVLLSWHESFRTAQFGGPLTHQAAPAASQLLVSNASSPVPDLSGNWDILEVEDDKHYTATLDKGGNGSYTQHGGRFVTTKYSDRLWQGTWQQPGNDREGGFEVLLSEDGSQAKGVWWYSRVGTHKNIPPREHGGTYVWKRIAPPPTAQ